MKSRNSTSSSDAKRAASEDGRFCLILVQSGPSSSDLPREILVNILLRLSVKRIIVCKCVCKTWYDVISKPDFAKLHFKQAEVYPLIRTNTFSPILSRSLYLVQPDKDDFEVKLGMHDCSKSLVNIKLDTKFTLPLRNLEKVLNKLNSDSGAERNDLIKLRQYYHGYRIVNSCNGLLCLSNESDFEPSVICNPITGEFINLPKPKPAKVTNFMASGFGFSPASNQYKVIRVLFRKSHYSNIAYVHTLGTESWRNVCLNTKLGLGLILCPTYLNGCVYWFSRLQRRIISFDIEKEQFNPVSIPALEMVGNTAMGVLGGELCLSMARSQNAAFWVMKDDSGNAWSKVFSVPLPFSRFNCYGSFLPIKYLNDGSLLMYNFCSSALVYKDRKNGSVRYVKVEGAESIKDGIAYIPSIVSLKDTLSGLNVKVLNVNSRCSELKLQEDGERYSLVELTFNEIDRLFIS